MVFSKTYTEKVYCDVISHFVQGEYLFLHKRCCKCQEPLLSHQEICRQNFPVIFLLLCQEMMEKMWKDLPS